ncbi:MAG: NHLP leader peptide family RiPP precursor [Lactobacillales bacterium]|jgi:hypothetical protein|nr:NHLP leader peptide family RiPP precursor [Lactobacillales bacterium]
MSWTQEEINEIYARVMQKATTDKEFRREVIVNPNQAIADLTGETVPDDYKIKVLENDPSYTATFVLPAMKADEKLNIDDLDHVAGGVAGTGEEKGEGVCYSQGFCATVNGITNGDKGGTRGS